MNSSANTAELIASLVICFIPFGLILWFCFIATVLSWFSGWGKLADVYRAFDKPVNVGKTILLTSGRVNKVRYKNSIHMKLSDEGLYMSIFPLFRAGHPPLLIPWDDIYIYSREKYWFVNVYNLHIGKPEIAKLMLFENVLKEAARLGYINLPEE